MLYSHFYFIDIRCNSLLWVFFIDIKRIVLITMHSLNAYIQIINFHKMGKIFSIQGIFLHVTLACMTSQRLMEFQINIYKQSSLISSSDAATSFCQQHARFELLIIDIKFSTNKFYNLIHAERNCQL